MISTKNQEKQMTPEERKQKVNLLREEHQDYFDALDVPNALFIPKMAYRPPGKDDLYISFFPSELQKSEDIYTEFVSIEYDSEDPKRTLYLLKHNPFWKEEYELTTSNAGFERYLIPVSELKIINDASNRAASEVKEILNLQDLPDPDETFSYRGVVEALERIAIVLEKIESKLK
jgi:hypothetical protein